VAILVDEIVGPEEVVVRSLPGLLKQHPLCSGATLSGMGEIVLVLDAHRLAELGVHRQRAGESSATIAVSQDAKGAARSPKVLVADDSLSARKRVIQTLGRYDVRVVEAGDGAEAIELLKTESFAAVFTDLEMPRVNGLQLLTHIKQDERLRHLPVVIISSRDDEELRHQASENGVHDYLGKPIEDEALDRAAAAIPALRDVFGRKSFTTRQHGEYA
jgi:chemosensory pili system protein ChpA (sensor histidine kinase/response regulator)